MKTNNVKKMFLLAAMTGTALVAAESIYNSALADCPGEMDKNYHYRWYGGHVHGVCDGSGDTCKTCISNEE
jgi:hypothetical protein